VIPKHYDLWEAFAADPKPLVEELTKQGYEAFTLDLGGKFVYNKR